MRASLKHATEKNILFYKLEVIFRSTSRLGNLFRFKDSLKKRIVCGISPTAIPVVTARLLITEMRSIIFLLECLEKKYERFKSDKKTY